MRKRRIRRAKRVAIIKKLTLFTFLYLIFFTVHFSMITLAKYTGTISKTGTNTVAKWYVSADNEITSKNISIVAGGSPQEYRLEVEDDSEVSFKYKIIISNIPNDITVALDNGTPREPSNNTLIFDAGEFKTNTTPKTREHTLSFNAPVESNEVSNRSITLDVVFVQDEL